jgi:DNA-directed RNA polymerase omega subunit
MAERLHNNAMYSIPDDQDHSTYRFIIVAAKRARQLQNSARPILPTTSKKHTVTSMEEVRRGAGAVLAARTSENVMDAFEVIAEDQATA